MKIAGLDFGGRTIGVAVSDALGLFASPVTIIRRKTDSLKGSLKELGDFLAAQNIELIVLGYPKNMNNTIGAQAEQTERFAKILDETFHLPVVLWDERLTSVSADKMMLEFDLSRKKRKEKIDAAAAAMILQNYLDYRKNTGDSQKPPSENKYLKNKLKLIWRMKSLDNEFNEAIEGEETEEFDVIVLTDDESGEDIELVIVDSVEAEDCTYLLVIASEDFDDEEPTASIIKEIKEGEDNFVYEVVEDEAEFEKASELFKDSDEFEIM